MKYLFTFEPSYTVRIDSDTENSESFVSVYASKYLVAVKKVLAMKLPNIDEETDLKWVSTQEEQDFSEDDGAVTA